MSTCFFETGSLTESRLSNWEMSDGQWTPGILVILPAQCWDYMYYLVKFSYWALGINLKSSCLPLADTHFSQCCFHLLKINSSSVLEIWALSKMYKEPTQLVFIFRGILSMSWSQADAELLLSSAKDNQIFCWNLASSEVGWSFYGHAVMEMWQERYPSYVFPGLLLMAMLSRQVVCKLPTQNSWCFDVQWCPQNPPVFSAVSFDGWISLYSVMGRSWEIQHMRQADKVWRAW